MKHNRKSVKRSVAAVAAALVFCVSLPLLTFADVLTDVPSISDVPETGGGSASGGSSSGGSVIIAPPGSENGSGSSSSGSSSGISSGNTIIITDQPSIGGNSDNGNSSVGGSSGNNNSSVGGAPAASSDSNSSAPAAVNSDTSTGKAPEAASTASTEAPAQAASENTSAETAASESSDISSTAIAGPSSAKTSSGVGSVYENSAVTRLNLDFSLITPTHSKGALKVARASVKRSDGSWQNFDYDDNIHFAFYKMKESRMDSTGLTWYIATVKARRFGDTYTDDGELKTELWLNSSDCIVRNCIDVSTTSPTRLAIVKAALSSLGKQYVYGGNGPDAYDCSGLVKHVCKEAGITVPRTSNQLLQMDGQITAAELRPGDLMVRTGHCGIYIGNGIFVHASDSSVGVVAEYLSVYNLSNGFTHYINVVGD